MARNCGQGRSLVLSVLLTALAVMAQETTGWNSRLKDGIAAIGSGHYEQAVQILNALKEQSRSLPLGDVRQADVGLALATAYQYQGHFDLAEPLFSSVISAFEAVGPRARHSLGMAQHGLAEIQVATGRFGEAEDLLRLAAENCRAVGGENDRCSIAATEHLGEAYVLEDRGTEAAPILLPVVDRLRGTSPPQNDLLVDALHNLAAAYRQQGRYDIAEPLLKESLSLSSQFGELHPIFADRLVDLGGLYRLEHNSARGEPLLAKAAHIYEINNDPHLADALSQLGLIALEEGKYAIAKQNMERSLAIYRKTFGPDHVMIANADAGLAQAYLGERNYKQADSLIQRAISIGRACLGEAHAGIARLLMVAAKVQEREHRSSQADQYYRQALSIYRRTLPSDHPDRTEAEQEYAQFTKSQRK